MGPWRNRVKFQYLAAAASVLAATPVNAQQSNEIWVADTIRPETITVVATGSPQPVDRTGQPITVLTAADLARLQGPDITRALEQVPGPHQRR